MTQADAVTLARGKVDGLSDVLPDGLSEDRMSFVQQVIGDRDLRRQVNDCLKDEALHGEGPWQVQNVTADDIGGFSGQRQVSQSSPEPSSLRSATARHPGLI